VPAGTDVIRNRHENLIVALVILAGVGLLTEYAAAQGTNSRLTVTLVPVWVYVEDAETGELRTALSEDLNTAYANFHEAMRILGVSAYRYSVQNSDNQQTLKCTNAQAGSHGAPQCIHPHDGPYGVLRQNQILEFPYTMTGLWSNGPEAMGQIRYFVLLPPKDFVWGNTYYGATHWWSWDGHNRDPAHLHWSTTSCDIWSSAWVLNMAHELGHCFGLYHGDTDGYSDPNYDGVDNSMDLMSNGAHFYVDRLRPSNRARVQHHFRELRESIGINDPVGAISNTVDPGSRNALPFRPPTVADR